MYFNPDARRLARNVKLPHKVCVRENSGKRKRCFSQHRLHPRVLLKNDDSKFEGFEDPAGVCGNYCGTADLQADRNLIIMVKSVEDKVL